MLKGIGDDADVIVVGAGPGGSSTAYHLAQRGIDVLLIEKSAFPRDKVCGDGLTPAAIRELVEMGIRPDNERFAPNKGLRVVGGGHSIELLWPKQKSRASYGGAMRRIELDELLAQQAQKAGARLLENTTVTGAITDVIGNIVGVKARIGKGKDAQEKQFRARYIVDAGGVSARLATSCGYTKHDRRPMAVAARAYFRSPLAQNPWMESHLELWDGKPGQSKLLPGYGWIFPLSDGLVNVGLGSVSSGAKATKLPYKQIFASWTANLPEEWGLTEENMVAPLRSAALPMAFNRTPHYRDGMLLVGDAGGMVSPYNGEGIAPAMLAGRIGAATIAQALARPSRFEAEQVMTAYPAALREEYGGYYQLGRIFVALIERPEIMRVCTRYGLGRPMLMRFVHKLLSDGYERSGGDLSDRFLAAITKVVPSV